MKDKEVTARLAAAEVLSGLYEAIADPSQFDGLLSAMDEFIDADPDGLEAGNADWKDMFRQHFSRVGQFLDTETLDDRETPIVFVDRQVVPSAVINRSLEILASNSLLDGLFGDDQRSLSGCLSTPADEKRLSDLFKANGDPAPVLVSFTLPHLETPVFVVAARSPILDIADQTGALVTIKVAKATWNPDLTPLLETAYGLTSAEIEVLEGLVELGAVTSVAEQRKRSVRTVRTQLTQIFSKLGLSSQTELALFLATLTQLMTKTREPSDIGREWSRNATEITRHMVKCGTETLAYLRYGDRLGTPVIIVHTTTPPEMTPEFRRACRDAGLNVFACHKPGAGGSSHRSSKDGPEELASSYLAVMDAEEIDTAIIAGHCSGGLYALEAAKQFPEKFESVILIDTGVPFKGRRELMTLPKSFRRTLLPARYIPEVLLVPHRIFAANFKRSKQGEARVVDYFFEDSPVDQTLTRLDRTYYEITRQIIEYSFADVERLVADVCRWASDWSDKLELSPQTRCVFVHGKENPMFRSTKITSFIDTRAGFDAVIAPEFSQLQVYQDPGTFIAAVRSLLDG